MDPNITITANGNINGMTASITGSYTSGDVLASTATLPSGITVASFNTATRSLVFSGSTTAANWQAIARGVTLQTTSAVCNPESRLVSFVVGIKYYNIINGHFYEYYSTAGSWTSAKSYADNSSYFGRQGYLATVSASSENSFSYVLVGQNSWIGCSDNYVQVNAALGYTAYANQTAADGNFYWITGPERGTKISSQNAWQSGGVMPVSGVYNNWTSGEPNDYPNNGTVGEEDYGHMYTGTGLWNDFPNSSSIGAIIEYGGMPNDVTTSQVVTTRSIYINGAPSGTITGGNVSVCPSSNSTTLTLTGLTGTIVRWESSLDNFLTAGTTISNTTTSLTVTNISTTTYYRAVVNTSSGCTNLVTSATPVYVTTTVAGNIVAANNTICAGSAASFNLYGNAGNVIKWQVSTSSTFASSVTDISNTTTALSYTLGSTGTYYFRAVVQNNGCATVNTPGYTITVTSGTSPVGGSVTNAEHCGGTNSGSLTLSGHTGSVSKWQYSTDGGIIWTDVSNTTTTLSYSGVSANRIYRAVLTNGSCGTTYSSYGTITVYGTTVTRWDGGTSGAWQTSSNWCGGIADNGIDIVISSSATNSIVLDQNRIVGNINFNGSGKNITLGNFDLTVGSFSNAGSTSYIKTTGTGSAKTSIGNNASVTFPVGNSAYDPVTITNKTGSSDYMSVRVLDEVYYNGLSGFVSTLGRVKRTWEINKTNANGGAGINFVFNWNAGETFNLVSPSMYHYTGGTWVKQTGTTSVVGNTLTYTGYTGTFSPFAVGSAATPLPINMVSFEVEPQQNPQSAALTWITASEINNRYFEVQRSIDGNSWESIGRVEGGGTTNGLRNYQYTDYHPSTVCYYRLKQFDFEGKFSYSDIRKVSFNVIPGDVKVYPNPAKGSVFIYSADPGTYTIYDANGRTVAEGTINGQAALENMAAGLYMITISAGEEIRHIKLMVE